MRKDYPSFAEAAPSSVFEPEADALLVVDADAVLAVPITPQGFEAVAGWDSQALDLFDLAQPRQFPPCYHDERLPLFLLTVFGKNEQANLTKAGRSSLAKLVDVLVTLASEKKR